MKNKISDSKREDKRGHPAPLSWTEKSEPVTIRVLESMAIQLKTIPGDDIRKALSRLIKRNQKKYSVYKNP